MQLNAASFQSKQHHLLWCGVSFEHMRRLLFFKANPFIWSPDWLFSLWPIWKEMVIKFWMGAEHVNVRPAQWGIGGGSTVAKVRGGQGSKVLLLCCLQEGSSRSYHCLSCHYWLIKLQISLHYYSYYYNLCYFCSSSNSSSFGEMYYKISG